MKVSDGFKTLVLDNLADLGDVTPRSMFGGVGLYCGGLFFGIMAADVLYLKVDDSNRRDYDRRGMQPLTPYVARPITMKYYAVPIDVVESPLELIQWARKAVAVAARAAGGA
jgi:DNA transformation protein